MYNRELVTNERLAELKIIRAEMRDAKFFEVEKKFSGKVQISFERYPRSLS